MTTAMLTKSENGARLRYARFKDLLDVDSLSRNEIQDLIDRAREFRSLRATPSFKSDILRGVSIYTLFFENSTRTRVSFEHAGKALGADVINISASTSSVSKGESLLNTALTLDAMGVDALVIRHPHSGAPHFVSRHVNATVINAGDGAHAHPTQGLLDVMTLQDSLGDLRGVKLAIVGDIVYSRVARSAIFAFNKMGADIAVAAPRTLLPYAWVHGWEKFSVVSSSVMVCESLEEALKGADAVMCLRLQLERQTSGLLPKLDEYSKVWGINSERLELAKEDVVVMHPGPMNEGLEISTEIAHGANSLVEKQVANGVAMRMAVLEHYCSTIG